MQKYKFFYILMLFFLFMPVPAYAAFEELIDAGAKIFKGLREIIYPASAVGIIAICIGGFFGNINWKWLTAIILGLIVISLCAGFVAMFAPNAVSAIPQDIAIGS